MCSNSKPSCSSTVPRRRVRARPNPTLLVPRRADTIYSAQARLMRHTTLSVLVAVALVTGCSGGDGDLGDSCSQHGDCQSRYQCVQNVCVNRCQRSPECGDGYACDDEGL